MTEPITITLQLGPNGFIATLPTGRTLNISADEAGARFIKQMLWDAEARRSHDARLSGVDFPTQEIARIWEREERKRIKLAEQRAEMKAEREAAKERQRIAKAKQNARVWAKRGIDTSKIKINL